MIPLGTVILYHNSVTCVNAKMKYADKNEDVNA